MGGDHGPAEVVPGALDHARAHPEDHVLLVGDRARITDIGGDLPPNVEIVPASQVIEMHEHPALALREKKDSLDHRRVRPRQGRARRRRHDGGPHRRGDGRRHAPDRAAAGRRSPGAGRADGPRGRPFVLLDIGANPDSTPENLVQYARMGAIFAERVVGIAAAAGRAPLDRRGEGQGRPAHPARDGAARRLRTCGSWATSRARTSLRTWPTWS